jgi:hypothetical protein
MKNIKKVTWENNYGWEIIHVESKPGDATRYDYFSARDHDDYVFMPADNTFRYPQRLNYWEVKELLTTEEINKLADLKICNPFTLRECIRTVIEWQEGRI